MSDKWIIEKFLLTNDLSTYDPYDIWKTSLGIKVKKIYYKNKYLGFLPAAILTIYDLYINNNLRIGYKKQEYPIVRAQAALTLLNLYKRTLNHIYLDYAYNHIRWLIKNSSPGYSGYCWGTGFKIVISDKLIYHESIPFATNTPYIIEALYEYYLLTRDKNILRIIKSTYQFYEKDIKILKCDKETLATSYAPLRDRIVTNAVAYTLFVYSIFYKILNNKKYLKTKMQKMLNFIVSVQQKDGSWVYAPYDKNSFIDCFHSVFILKNIIKTIRNIELDVDIEILKKGYDYLKNNFYNSKYGLFKRFSVSNKPCIVKFDLYDNAEMLYLSKLRTDFNLSRNLDKSIKKTFFKNYDIFSIVDFFGTRKNKNTLRWAVMPYILARFYNDSVR